MESANKSATGGREQERVVRVFSAIMAMMVDGGGGKFVGRYNFAGKF
jgi:hypothetical protein